MSFSATVLNLPTIVIIHDAWHTPTHYSKMIDLLSVEGFEVACPQLLSCSSEVNSRCSFNDDVSLMYQLVFDLVSDGKSVICVMHGYGGYIGTEILSDLCASQRTKDGRSGGVVHMVWISAVLPGKGVSMQMAMGGEFPDYTPLQKDGTLVLLEPDRYLFNDLGAMEMVHWCGHLVRWNARAEDVVCHADIPAYVVCPSTYVICGEDQLISEAGQRYMISLAKDMGATISEELLEIAGHDPMCSDAESLVAIISHVAAEAMEPDLGDDVRADGEALVSQMDGATDSLAPDQTDENAADQTAVNSTPRDLSTAPADDVPTNAPQAPTPLSVMTPTGFQTLREDADDGVATSRQADSSNDDTPKCLGQSDHECVCCCGAECPCSMKSNKYSLCCSSSCSCRRQCAGVQAGADAVPDYRERMDSWASNVATLGADDYLDTAEGPNFNPDGEDIGVDSMDIAKRSLTRSATAPAMTEDASTGRWNKASFLPLAERP